MSVIRNILGLMLVLVFSACTQQKVFTKEDIQIIPEPAELKLNAGSFEFSKNTEFVIANAANADAQKEICNILIDKFEKTAEWRPIVTSKTPTSNYVKFNVDTSFENEAYRLEVTENHIDVTAKNNAGFLYGLETIRQLLPIEIESQNLVKNTAWLIPNVSITDKPRFQYRGLMLDLSRHFFGKDYIKKTIDRLAMHKMNTLHLHLVDDQGWRIEIKKYPKLTEVGAWRVDQEHIAMWNGRPRANPDEKGTFGGFLTQAELKDIVSYAQSKNVEIIPEIEMPAHVSCAIAAYPELSCLNEHISVPSGGVWPITDIYCAGKDSTFDFLENVLDEVMTIFPSKYIHIGGDEATKTNWEKCPHCKKRMQQEDIKNTHELQSYFVKRIEKYINSKGKKLIGWDEILEGGLAPDATVMSWRGVKGGFEASEQGHDVIMTPGTHCYFDHYQGIQSEEPLAFGGYTPLSKVYQFDPIVDSMSVAQKKHVLGGQANLWAEYIPTTKQSEYMIFPRLAALSETLWSPKESRNWDVFSSRIKTMFKRYEYLDINYAKSAYQITFNSKANITMKEVGLSLNTEFSNADIRYVLGDKKIDETAIKYTDTIKLKETTIVKASLFENEKPFGKIYTDTIHFHKAVAHKVNYNTPLNDYYLGDNYTLVNAIRGSKNFHDGQWQGWLTENMEVIIDLENIQTVKQVIMGLLESQLSGIYYPTDINVLISNDGKSYKQVGKIKIPYILNYKTHIKDFKINFEVQAARYIKVIATNLKKNPKGDGVFIFADEVLVN
ncbi:glycoside hydrolase family 20 protein [Thalassobellus sediminis]|uniref:glycoside hydrolase family 20 protein n=1 Tax=Thalassobellus sediminis TaxID=3367753 RepID=UPI003791FE53